MQYAAGEFEINRQFGASKSPGPNAIDTSERLLLADFILVRPAATAPTQAMALLASSATQLFDNEIDEAPDAGFQQAFARTNCHDLHVASVEVD